MKHASACRWRHEGHRERRGLKPPSPLGTTLLQRSPVGTQGGIQCASHSSPKSSVSRSALAASAGEWM